MKVSETLGAFMMGMAALLSAGGAVGQTMDESRPELRIRQGVLVGRVEQASHAFLGIPYAAPPVGPMRWRPPGPAPRWTQVRDAGVVGAICIQPPSGGDPGVGPGPMSEDCLTLNVWTPVERTGPLPVMVWIHGGGYNNGSGTAAMYNGAPLAGRGVVVVTINYRLGRLGFFDHPALAAERPEGEPAGNYGLMDMIAALEWVRDNITVFGGDPDQVTIFGESAGGVAITQMMVSPPARGLFARAVVQSGLGRQQGVRLAPSGESLDSAQARGAAWARSAGVLPTADALRALPAERFLSPAPSIYGGDLTINDGVIVRRDITSAFARGEEAPVPMIIGTNSAEFWWMKPTDPSPYTRFEREMAAKHRAALIAVYGGQENYDAHIVSDVIFSEPARHLARLHARNGAPTFLYRFDAVAEASTEPHEGATHASERPFVFDTLASVGWASPRDLRTADIMAGYWTEFARFGDPNGEGRLRWPDTRSEPDRLLEFTNDGAHVQAVPNTRRLDLIEALYARKAPEEP